MNMPKCFILCNLDNNKSNYIISSFAGSNMSYFLGKLISNKYEVVFVNVGAPKKPWNSFIKEQSYFENGYKIVEFACGPSFLPTRFKVKIMIRKAIKYIFKHRKQDDKVIIYHSISFSKFYNRLLYVFGRKNAILHVAELYSEVGDISYSIQKEVSKISVFEKFIFMSDGLSDRIVGNNRSKKQIIIYGVYDSSLAKQKRTNESFFHVVYAGTASKIKGGLFTALRASNFLPDNFIVHIYCRADDDLRKEFTKYNIVYEGYVSECELNKSISNYDIGLATQNPYLPFNKSSFPSKIVNYLSCGLNVVSSKSESVLKSPFNNCLFYYDEDDTGENCANAIIEASKRLNHVSSNKTIQDLYTDAVEQISALLEVKL